MFAFATALFASISLTPAARQLAFRSGTIEYPGSRRKLLFSTPLFGGLAMYAGAVLATILVTIFWVPIYAWQQIFSIVTGATLMMFAGILNDRNVLTFRNNLMVAMPVAVFILLLSGIHITVCQNMLAGYLSYPVALLADYALTFVWVIGMTVAFSILDHLEGICTGVAAISAAFFLLFAFIGNQGLVGTLAAATLGASLGFLYWNLNTVKITMGRGGTMFLGFVIAVLSLKIRYTETPVETRWMIPTLILGFVLFDIVLVAFSQIRQGKVPFSGPSSDHIVHRIVGFGVGRMRAVMTIYIISTMFGLTALLASQLSVWKAQILVAMVAMVTLLALVALERASRIQRAGDIAVHPSMLHIRMIQEPWLKRPLDVFLSAFMILVTMPIWILIAVAIMFEDGGPIFFRQERWGRGGTTFWVYKFRSMVMNADRLRQAAENDRRITRVGKILRAMGLDELPQVINIWKGEMSFVGPRALVVGELVRDPSGTYVTYETTPGFFERLAVRPGLTSIATIYIPKDAPPHRKFRYDLLYIRKISFWLDVHMIALSYWISIRGKWETRKRKV